MAETVIGIPCYSADDYPTIRVMMDDAQTLPRDYEAWKRSADMQARLFRQGGAEVHCVRIAPREFADWCRAEGLQPDALARTRFVTLAAQQRSR
jgi:hypothetical protein